MAGRAPGDALRRVARVTREEAAAIADTWPAGAEWLERLAARVLTAAEATTES